MDASCTLTQRLNNSFGTVTSYNDGTPGNNLPGIVFTPSRVSTYFVCAKFIGSLTTAGQEANFQMLDGSGTVINAVAAVRNGATANHSDDITMCGIYNATSTSSKTIRIYGAATGGSTVSMIPTATSGGKTIEWSIYQID